MTRLLVYRKWLMSFLRSPWTVDDYPVVYREQIETVDDQEIHRGITPPRWAAHIVKWPLLIGLGETRQEAREELDRHIRTYIGTRGVAPRPGTFVAPTYAPNDKIRRYSEIADRLFREVLEFEPEHVGHIADSWSLSFLKNVNPVSEYQSRIRHVFGVDVSDIEDGNIGDICERIHRSQLSSLSSSTEEDDRK